MFDTTRHDQLLSLAHSHGAPLFVYETATIDQQIKNLSGAFQVPSLEIRYACKALSTIGVVNHIYQRGCGIDTVSPGEITIALLAGVPPDQISFTPSGVLTREYEYALSEGVHIHVDQFHILKWLDEHFPGTAITLRFNPAVRAGGHTKLQVGSEGSKFGFLSNQVDEVKKLTDTLSLKVTGVHMHLGSDIGESESFNQAYEYLLSIANLWIDTLEKVDVGGGFKIAYHPDDPAIHMKSFGESVSKRFTQFCKEAGRDITLVLEPGKYLVSASGYLLMEVTGVRESSHMAMAFVSSGFNHFLRPMSYGAYHHIINLSNPGGQMKMYDVVGYLCETDTFAENRSINEIRNGDILCLMNAGAYGFSMASNYNSRCRPAEVLLYPDGTSVLIRRAETITDLLRTDVYFKED